MSPTVSGALGGLLKHLHQLSQSLWTTVKDNLVNGTANPNSLFRQPIYYAGENGNNNRGNNYKSLFPRCGWFVINRIGCH